MAPDSPTHHHTTTTLQSTNTQIQTDFTKSLEYYNGTKEIVITWLTNEANPEFVSAREAKISALRSEIATATVSTVTAPILPLTHPTSTGSYKLPLKLKRILKSGSPQDLEDNYPALQAAFLIVSKPYFIERNKRIKARAIAAKNAELLLKAKKDELASLQGGFSRLLHRITPPFHPRRKETATEYIARLHPPPTSPALPK